MTIRKEFSIVMKNIISILLVILLTLSLYVAALPANAASVHTTSTASDDEDYGDDDEGEEGGDEGDEGENSEEDNEEEGSEEGSDEGGSDDSSGSNQYDDSVEGSDPVEKTTTYSAAEKAADENNFIARQYCGERLNWYIKNGELVVFGNGEMYYYSMPEDAPWYYQKYSKITIRHGVTSIGGNAFAFSNARTLTLPSSVTEIGVRAFFCASELERVALGKDMVSVGSYAFYNCEKLADVTLNNNLFRLGESAFEKCTSLGDIRFPKTLKYIYANTFKGCTSMCSVILRKGQLEIQSGAFENCSQLKTINMPNTITAIDNCAFKNCSYISFDNLPADIVVIGEYAFENNSLLNEVSFPNKLAEVGNGAFKNSGIKNITINSALKVFNTNMLEGCKNVVVNVKCNTPVYKAFKKVSGYTVNCIQHDNKALPVNPATFSKDGVASGSVCQSCGEKTNYRVIRHISTVILKSTKLAYTGKPVQPKVIAYSADGKTIAAKNYSVTYPDKRINIGRKRVKVVFKADYSGSKVLYYTILPQTPVATKIKAKTNGFTLSWKKNTTQKDGYQIQYSKSKNFTGVTSVAVKGAKMVTKTVTKANLSGRVYVRIRAYKKVSGKTYYSGFSKVKSVKVG